MAKVRSIEIASPGPAPARSLTESPFLLPADIRALGGHAYVYGTDATDNFGYDLIQDTVTGVRTVPGGYSEPAIGWVPLTATTYLDFPATSSKALFTTNNAMTVWAVAKPVKAGLTPYNSQWAISDGPSIFSTATNASIGLGMSNNTTTPTVRLSLRDEATQLVNIQTATPGGNTDPDRWCLMLATMTLTTAQVVIYRDGTRVASNLNTRSSSTPGSTKFFRTGHVYTAPQDLPILANGVILGALTEAQQDALYSRLVAWGEKLGATL